LIYKNDLLAFLQKDDSIDSELLDLIDFELKKRIYYSGDQFRMSNSTFPRTNFVITRLIYLLHNLLANFFNRKLASGFRLGLSSATGKYDELIREEAEVFIDRCNFSPKKFKPSIPGFFLGLYLLRLEFSLRFADFNYLISNEFASKVKNYRQELSEHIKKIGYECLFVSGDLSFLDRLLIKIFKDLDKKSFCLMHGLPSIYLHSRDSRTDYMTIWGSQQLSGYVSARHESSRFIITGHPNYKEKPSNLRFSLDNILVITKPTDGIPAEIDESISNRSESLRYIYQLEQVLRSLGVTKARLRVHPDENPKWYATHINLGFFDIDYDQLSDSLNKSSLVIGPVSTVFIDSLFHGVNYLVFEPLVGGKTIFGRSLTPLLDGRDKRVPVATSEDELEGFLKDRQKINLEIINEFTKFPHDLSKVIDIINEPLLF
jgi:hypothetical protein